MFEHKYFSFVVKMFEKYDLTEEDCTDFCSKMAIDYSHELYLSYRNKARFRSERPLDCARGFLAFMSRSNNAGLGKDIKVWFNAFKFMHHVGTLEQFPLTWNDDYYDEYNQSVGTLLERSELTLANLGNGDMPLSLFVCPFFNPITEADKELAGIPKAMEIYESSETEPWQALRDAVWRREIHHTAASMVIGHYMAAGKLRMYGEKYRLAFYKPKFT